MNLIFPFRKNSKQKPNRSHRLLFMLQIIFYLTGNVTQNTINFYNEPGYEVPFTIENMLSIFSSENIKSAQTFPPLKPDWSTTNNMQCSGGGEGGGLGSWVTPMGH